MEEEWARIGTEPDVPPAEVDRIRQAFTPIAFAALPAMSEALETAKAADRGLARFARNNLHAHKQPGYAIVDISLKAPGETPGDCSADQMDAIADLADAYGQGDVRVTHEQTWCCRTCASTTCQRSMRG